MKPVFTDYNLAPPLAAVPAGAVVLAQNAATDPISNIQRIPVGLLGTAGSTEGTTTAVGAQANFAFGGVRVLRCNNATLLTLSGLAAGVAGQLLDLVSVGTGQVDLLNLSGGSAAANQLVNGVTATLSLAAGTGRVRLVYDGVTAKWRVLEHEQGAWITPAYDAGSFTSSGGGTWTVDAGEVLTFAYRLQGRTLHFSFVLQTTTTAGLLNDLRIILPNGCTAAKRMLAALWRYNGGVGPPGLMSHMEVRAGETFLRLYYDPSETAWAAVADNMYVSGSIAVEVS